HDINVLTVIASESYEEFAKGLQNEIAKSLKDRPVKVDTKFFLGKVLTNEMGETLRLTDEDAKKLNKFLYKHDILDDDDKITAEGKELIEKNQVPVPENLVAYASAVSQLLQTVYNGKGIKPDNDRNTVPLTVNKNFAKKEFQELWKKISLKTVYEVHFDTDKLIN